jgi:hypothetical protein
MLVFVAVSMVVLMGFLALTLDVGAGNRERRIAQTAADAAAIGGAAELFHHVTDANQIAASAQAEALRNGFDDGASDVVVQVFYPASTGPHAGDPAYVEVTIDKTTPTIFGAIFNVTSMNIHTRAVAGYGSYALNCVYSLDPSGAGAITVQNGGELDTNCGIAINSTNAHALDVNSSGEIDTSGGGVTVAGGWTGNKTPIPAPSTGAGVIENPLKDLAMPTTVPACDFTTPYNVSGTVTLNPGVYCGGINIATGSNTANLNPGVYYLKGGMTVGNSGRVFGTGVTIINTFDGTYPYGVLNFGTGCKARLSAPTSGAWKGILFFQDPAAPPDLTNTFACSSDTPPELTGTLYFPTQTFLFNGSNTTTQITGTVIAKQVIVSGKTQINNETSGNSAIQRFFLVE